MGRRTRAAALALVLTAACTAFIATTRAGAVLLASGLALLSSPVEPSDLPGRVDAIVVLGGRTARIHEGARFHLATGVPLLLTGKGTGDSGFAAESEKMEDILLRQYGLGPRWVETESRTTHENAVRSWCLAASMGVRRIALITDPMHMPRAWAEFVAAGFRVLPVPAQDAGARRREPTFESAWRSFVPGADGWQEARRPLLEWGGAMLALLARLGPSPACDRS